MAEAREKGSPSPLKSFGPNDIHQKVVRLLLLSYIVRVKDASQ
jgi:hypothetical protein